MSPQLLILVSSVLAVHAAAAVVSAESDSLHTDEYAQGLIDTEDLSVNAIGRVEHIVDDSNGRPHARRHKHNHQAHSSHQHGHRGREASRQSQMMRSEKVVGVGDAHTFRLEATQSEAKEQPILEPDEQQDLEWFQRWFDGEYITMTDLPVKQVNMRDGGVPTKAIDGNAGSLWKDDTCTHTKIDKNPWWQVDLQHVHIISCVEVTVRSDCCGWHCDECPMLTINIDWEPCAKDAQFTLAANAKEVACPWVGDLMRVILQHDWNYLMLCEVRVKGRRQNLIQMGIHQCEKHNFLVHSVRSNGTDGHCVAGLPAQNDISEEGFREIAVGRPSADDGELRATSEECEEHLLKSHETVKGAVWRAIPGGGQTSSSMGSCRLLMGRHINGVQPAEGTRCFQKLRCPRDLAPWKKRAFTPKGQSWLKGT